MKNTCFTFFFLLTSNFFLNAQTNVIINAAKDNTIYSDNTGNSNGAGDNFTTGAIAAGPVRRGLIMFDLSSIPAGANITEVTLTLNMNRTISGAANVSLHRLTENWGEGASNAGSGADGQGAVAQIGDATWICSFSNGAGGCNTFWGTTGSVYNSTASSTTSVNGNGTYNWTGSQLIADVQSWVNAPANNFGWVIIGDEATAGSAKRFASRTNPITLNRPSLSVTYTLVVPITLLYFKAKVHNNETWLSWQTAQEINNDFFELEFSTDAINFNPIGKVKGAGTSSVPQSYSYRHRPNKAGKIFYRLSQTDFNGRKTYSTVEMVELKMKTDLLLIVPNPVTDKLYISGLTVNGGQIYSIINLLGEKIAENILLSSMIKLPNNIPEGTYLLRIISDNGTVQSARFVKH